MLAADALRFGAWKKRIAWLLFQQRDLATAQAIHVTSAAEGEAVRSAGFRQPLATIPNGVALPSGLDAHHHRRHNGRRRRALFLSRLHPIKGLLNLVSAWAQVRPAGWELAIVGPDVAGHRSEVFSLIQREGLADSIAIHGAASDDEKWKFFQDADLFVLPSYTENFGIVVAEALGCGLPVIATKGTPWRGLVENQCGWWIDVGVEPLEQALKEATALSADQRHELGRRGREYVAANFSWDSVAARMRAVYEWMLHGGQAPDSVRLD
jgi:glycosyltransferase involved in cell wall biosynthesis